MIGRTISHYQIVKKLGEGGMGVVYKAQDLKLRRPVALKFLAASADEFRTRLLIEAEAAAALSHPNICTIYEVDDERLFLAMEFIDGETIAQKIKAGPLALDAAIEITMQAGNGLQAAHDKGIIHRDIKSSNLIMTHNGQIKILDFGLALTQEQTRITGAGDVLGTPAYMSPEQASAKNVDHRTDIWSLGVVLYEMLSGQLPFRGEKHAIVVHSILNNYLQPLSSLRSGLPVEIDRIMGKALAKVPGERYQHASDLCADLRRLQLRGITGPERRPISRRTFVWASSAAAAGVAAVWAVRSRRVTPHQPAVNSVIPIPEGAAQADPGRLLGPPVVSPDGTTVVVSLKTDTGDYLFVRRLEVNKLVRLDASKGASYPFWSPDSKHIAFFADGKLRRMPAVGGTPVVVCDAPQNRGGAWARTGVMIFGINGKALFRVPDSGGEPEEITKLDASAGENSHRYPVFLPDGNRFLYFARTNNLDKRGIYLESVDRKQSRRRILVADGQFAIGLDPSSRNYYLLSQQAGKIVAQPFDIDRSELVGQPVALLDRAGQVSVSDTGVLVLRPEHQDLSRLVWRDRSGTDIGNIGEPTDYWAVALSHDDQFAAAVKHDYLSGQFVIWMAPVQRGLLEPFSTSQHASSPVWSQDSRTLYYTDNQERKILRRAVLPKGEEEVVVSVNVPLQTRDVSPDQQYIAAELTTQGNQVAVSWSKLDQIGWTNVGTGPLGLHPHFSPDGKWLAFGSVESGNPEIYVINFPGGTGRVRVSAAGGSLPRWRRDGKELFYLAPDGSLMSVEIRPDTEFRFSPPKPLFHTSLRRGSDGPLYDVTGDGERFLMISGLDTLGESNIDMTLNWPSLLA
jgi:serine/threonine protein kinase/Tol biopolymer transport system component